ncbi:hypothetical protein D3C71_1239720 [compost metagenome]
MTLMVWGVLMSSASDLVPERLRVATKSAPEVGDASRAPCTTTGASVVTPLAAGGAVWAATTAGDAAMAANSANGSGFLEKDTVLPLVQFIINKNHS